MSESCLTATKKRKSVGSNEYLSLVNVVVCPSIRSSYSHDDKVATLNKVVVDGRLQLVSVLLDPFAKVDG
jgi:hypothetical protein